MADLQQDQTSSTIYGYSQQRQSFVDTIETDIKPFYVSADQVDQILDERIDPDGTISYELKPLNVQATDKPLTGPLNANGKRFENIGVLPDLSSLESIIASANTAVNVTSMSTYVQLYNALNTLYAGPLFTTINFKDKRPYAVSDGQIPLITDTPAELADKNKGLLNTGQVVDHVPSDIAKIRDPLDIEVPNRPFFDCDERVMQRALDPVVNQDLVTLGYMKNLTLNRNNLTESDYDCENRRISSLLEPEEVKELMTELQRNLEDTRAVNQKFMRDTAITRLKTVRENPPGTFNYNTVYTANNKILADLANAQLDKDALPFKQAKDKFLAKDGATIDINSKRCVNGVEAVDSTDLVIKSQLDDLETELTDLINNVGGNGTSVLDIISLIASLTSLAASLSALGLKAGTALTSVAQAGSALLNGVLAMSSILKDAQGVSIGSATQKIANGTSLNDYAPDPSNPQNWAEQQADLDRLRQGARDVENSASRPLNSVGGSWFNSVVQGPLFIQRQMFNAFELIA